MPLTSGEHFAGYRILGMLGSGGMGEVYLAQHPRLPRRDAVKVLPREMSSDPEFRERFGREADLAAALFHPHIVGVHDRGEFDGQLWISMDFIDGTDAGRLLIRNYPTGLPLADVVEIVEAIAEALDYAHESGLLHRDVKPGNILLTRPGAGRRRILLADFGIARTVHDTSDMTRDGMALGTVNYCSPEQVRGETMDGRADQYALAATTFELLTGVPPFDDPNKTVVAGYQISAPTPSVGFAYPALAQLDPVFAAAMAKSPNGRYRSCVEFASALAAHMPADRGAQAYAPAGPASQRPPTAAMAAAYPPATPPPYPAAPMRRSVNWPLVIGALVAILIIGGLFLAFPRSQQDGTGSATSKSEPSSTTTVTSDAPPSVTFESMRDLVTGYYANLPGQPNSAWEKLAPAYQQQTGLDGYLDFWGSMRAVTLVSITPRDDSSVVARLTYVSRNGAAQSEDRWLSVELVNGQLLITDSQRIGGA